MIRPSKRMLILLCFIFFAMGSFLYAHWSTRTLSVHVGKQYAQVAKDSTFAVIRNTATYPENSNNTDDPVRPSSTWITTPTVIEFDDAEYGFKLPATVFGAITYRQSTVSTITTSPMLEAVPYVGAVQQLRELQSFLKNKGWKLQPGENNGWLKVDSVEEREELQTKLFTQADGVDLYVPGKYSLLLLIKCHAHCNARESVSARYLIDISIGRDRTEK